MRKSPTPSTIKKLLAVSGNRCAFPDCTQPLVNEHEAFVGQVCHIEAAEPGGERYNPEQSDEDRRSFSNLMLMCANHHIITNDTTKFDVPTLTLMKTEHEKQYITHPYNPPDEVKKQLDRLLDIVENNQLAITDSGDILKEDDYYAERTRLREEASTKMRSINVQLGHTSAPLPASLAINRQLQHKIEALDRRKAAADELYALEHEEVNNHYDELAERKLAEHAGRGTADSSYRANDNEKIEKSRQIALKKLKIKFGKK